MYFALSGKRGAGGEVGEREGYFYLLECIVLIVIRTSPANDCAINFNDKIIK